MSEQLSWEDLLKSIHAEPAADVALQSPQGDAFAIQEQTDFDAQAKIQQLDIERKEADQADAERKENMKARKNYARCIFLLLCVWVSSVMGVVIATGVQDNGFSVSDPVLIALITGVSVSIIGLFAVVANYLFPKS